MSTAGCPLTNEEVGVEEPQTCGQGLAENAVLPALLAAVIVTMAEVLEVHTRALESADPNAKAEHDVYTRLVAENRDIAARLEGTAEQMAGSRDLPMAAHDEKAMTAPEALEAFEAFATTKQKLLALLQQQADQDQQMRDQMRAAVGGAS
jgi:hypothetical protein